MTEPVVVSPTTPDTCPTCGSDDPTVKRQVVVERAQHGHIERRCADPWHGDGTDREQNDG